MAGSSAFLHCGFRQDELDCEQAVRYLSECCPGFDPMSVACTFSGGCERTTVPDLPTDQSECILSKSCDALVSARICDELTALENGPLHQEAEDGQNSDAEGLCQ
ncbi:MAG TPA: hypothetical protein VHU80_25240 [Polyangiaceae bacterium]|jgi:hypothetical protein|nr:hypothetical protein [Polyangiaceae bacterium]